MLLLGLVFACLGFVTDSGYALVAGTAGDLLTRSRSYLHVQRYVSGAVFVGLGAFAALTAPPSRN